MIANGGEFARLENCFFAGKRDQTAAMTVTAQERAAVLNGVKLEAASALMGVFCAVVFSPEHMQLVSGAASERRRFIDCAISQSSPSFAVTLYRFNKILQQRNTLLKSIQSGQTAQSALDVWDISIASYAAAVAVRRAGFIESMSGIAERLYDGISTGREHLTLKYSCGFFSGDMKTTEQRYLELLTESRQTDISLGYTVRGPQRDDMELQLDDRELRIYGSQGQKRSAVLSLKLAEAELLSKLLEEQPVALLDDVMSELDASRQDYLLNKLEDWQVFITCCDPSPLRLLNKGSVFGMSAGRLETQTA